MLCSITNNITDTPNFTPYRIKQDKTKRDRDFRKRDKTIAMQGQNDTKHNC